MKLKPILALRPALAQVLAIDPGCYHSAYIEFYPRTRTFGRYGKVANNLLLAKLYELRPKRIVIEMITSYGFRVGQTVFDTVKFIGEVKQFCVANGIEYREITRPEVKRQLGLKGRKITDATVRAKLISLFGVPGTKKAPGKTYGITQDIWAALAVAVAYVNRLGTT